MARVYIFGGFVLVIGMAAFYFLVLAKVGQKMFEKKTKEKKTDDE